MIRIDFTDGDTGKYVNSVYTPEGDWEEGTLHRVLKYQHTHWRAERDGGSEESFVDYLLRHRTEFHRKTSAVMHFAI